jgi:hypothetical protein
MYTHYSFVAEVARQRQANYAAQAATWRRHRDCAVTAGGADHSPTTDRYRGPRPAPP